MADDYFNYFTVIEEHFRGARGTGMFMLSPRDWALVETWQNAGIPLEAVLRGIDATFAKRRRRTARGRTQMVNSLAYCAQAIAEEARAMSNAVPGTGCGAKPPFELAAVRDFVARNAATLRKKGFDDIAEALESLDLSALFSDLGKLEQRLTAIEEKLLARLREVVSEDALLEIRQALERDLKPYRAKMTGDQIAMLEKQFLERRLMESAGLPRLSLFYL